MIKLILATVIALTSVANAKTLTFEPITIVGHVNAPKRTFHMKAMVITVKRPTSVKVEREFASARYTPACEWFKRIDATSVKVCGGSVVMVSDGTMTRSVTN